MFQRERISIRWGDKLARALEAHWQSLKPKPARPLAVAARMAEARDLAYALGHRVWLPPKQHLGWTLIHDPDPTFQPSPLHGVIYLRQTGESHLAAALASVAGRISTVGVTGKTSSRLENVFLSLGVSRFCAAGRMQFPPLTWHHDGRSSLADLVTWIDAEGSNDDARPANRSLATLGRLGILAADLLRHQCGDVVRHPTKHTTMPTYRLASTQWWAGQDPYTENAHAGFLYFPQAAFLFTPFNALPFFAGEILWRAVTFGLFAYALVRLNEVFLSTNRAPESGKTFLILSLLAVPSAWPACAMPNSIFPSPHCSS